MFDLDLDSEFCVGLDDRNDLDSVSGREAFEQTIIIRLTDLMHPTLPGLTNRDTAEEKIELTVNRVAQELDYIDSIGTINISQSAADPNTYEVEIIYTSEEMFDHEVTLT